MAKPLHERQIAALSKSARLADVQAILSETFAAADAALADAKRKKATSVDPAVDPAAARTARQAAADAELDHTRHLAAIEQLEAKEQDLLENERTAGRLKIYEEALAERDALRDDIADQWPKLCKAMIDLFQRITANDERLRIVNGNLPKGKLALEGAEGIARGVPGNFYLGGCPIGRLGATKLPAFDGPGLAWPVPPARYDGHKEFVAAQKAAEQDRKHKAAEIARYVPHRIVGKATVAQPLVYRGFDAVNEKVRNFDTSGNLWTGEIDTVTLIKAEEADRLRGLGMTVTRISAKAA